MTPEQTRNWMHAFSLRFSGAERKVRRLSDDQKRFWYAEIFEKAEEIDALSAIEYLEPDDLRSIDQIRVAIIKCIAKARDARQDANRRHRAKDEYVPQCWLCDDNGLSSYRDEEGKTQTGYCSCKAGTERHAHFLKSNRKLGPGWKPKKREVPKSPTDNQFQKALELDDIDRNP